MTDVQTKRLNDVGLFVRKSLVDAEQPLPFKLFDLRFDLGDLPLRERGKVRKFLRTQLFVLMFDNEIRLAIDRMQTVAVRMIDEVKSFAFVRERETMSNEPH